MKLHAIRISDFRGIRHAVELSLQGRNLVLRGDNGTGKSSIAQALRLALTGTLGRTAEDLPEAFVAHRAVEPQAFRIRVELTSGAHVERAGKDLHGDDEGARFRDACAAANPFLHRSEVHSVLNDSGAERFRYLERFLDLQQLDTLCAGLKAEHKRRATSLSELNTRRAEKLKEAAAGLATTAVPASLAELIQALQDEATTCGLEIPVEPQSTPGDTADSNQPAFDAVLDALSANCARQLLHADSPETADRRSRLEHHVRELAELVPPDHPARLLSQLARVQAGAHDRELVTLLKEARAAITPPTSRSTCPVCDQPINPPSLLSKLHQRIADLAELDELRDQCADLASQWRTFLDRLEAIELTSSGALPEPGRASLADQPLLQDLARQPDLSTSTLHRLSTLGSRVAEELAKLPSASHAEQLRSLAAAITTARSHVGDLDRLQIQVARDAELVTKLACVEKALNAARKQTAAQLLQELEQQVDSFYRFIHPPHQPDEVTGPPKIKVKNYGHGSASVLGTFNQESVENPSHIYSDGHLDTVGICIFLALRRSRADRNQRTDPHLLVLDDIVMSIDANHTERLLQLLGQHFRDHQILIFSHNELFARQCKRLLPAVLRLDIAGWSFERGPRILGHVDAHDQLRLALEQSANTRHLAGVLSQSFEELLVEAIPAFDVMVKSAPDTSLADRWNWVQKKLQKLSKQGTLPDLSPLFADLSDPVFHRNVLGCHYDEKALDQGLGVIQRYARAVLQLFEALRCADCKNLRRLRSRHDHAAGLCCACDA